MIKIKATPVNARNNKHVFLTASVLVAVVRTVNDLVTPLVWSQTFVIHGARQEAHVTA